MSGQCFRAGDTLVGVQDRLPGRGACRVQRATEPGGSSPVVRSAGDRARWRDGWGRMRPFRTQNQARCDVEIQKPGSVSPERHGQLGAGPSCQPDFGDWLSQTNALLSTPV